MQRDLCAQLQRLILHSRDQLYSIQQGPDEYLPQKTPFTVDILEKHVDGALTLAVTLLQPGTNTARAGVIDIDAAPGALPDALRQIQKLKEVAAGKGIAAYIEFSGRRGFHLWVFADNPLPGVTWIDAILGIGALAAQQIKEHYPAGPTVTSDGKEKGAHPIKLPYGLHKGSGKRSGFLNPDLPVEWGADGLPQVPDNQGELMASFKQTPVADIAALASLKGTSSGGSKKPEKETDFSNLAADEHPGCISFFLKHGIPTDQEYNAGNITLVRYCVSRGLNDGEAIALADTVARATSDLHPTEKDHGARLRNFGSTMNTARRDPERYRWGCGYVRASAELVKSGGCPGWECAFWPYEHESRLPEWKGNPADFEAEREILVYVLSRGDEALHEALTEDVPAEGFLGKVALPSETPEETTEVQLHSDLWRAFIALGEAGREVCCSLVLGAVETGLDWKKDPGKSGAVLGLVKTYLHDLSKEHPCNRDTFFINLRRVKDTGLRILALRQTSGAITTLRNRDESVAGTLDTLATHTQALQRRTVTEILPLREYTSEMATELFGESGGSIPTPAPWLNHSLNGGWQPGRLYVIGAPPGGGKTTFCAWCADYAASLDIPVLFVSYEMGRQQLWVYALARTGCINSGLIEGKRWQDEDYKHAEWLSGKVVEAAKAYNEKAAQQLTIIEAGPEVTAAYLKGAVAQVRHNAGLEKAAPVLMIIDYLQLMLTGDEKLDAGPNETLRVSRLATTLKQMARDTGASVIAISDITKQAYIEAVKTGSLDMAALRDSFKIAHAADCIMLLQTGKVAVKNGKGNGDTLKDQMQLLEERYTAQGEIDKARQISKATRENPLDPAIKATYARLSVLKNRGGMLAEPLFVYERAYHRFVPIDLDPGTVEGIDDEAYDAS